MCNSIGLWVKRYLEIGGIIIAIGFLTTFIGMWVVWNAQGYETVKFGEPNLAIKYIEWFLGVTGIIILIGMLKQRLDILQAVKYDPPV